MAAPPLHSTIPLRAALILTFATLLSTHPAVAATTNNSHSTIPYVASRNDTVRDMLWQAGVGTNDVVYDLGSGDGRVVIGAVKDFHARRAVGIELDAKLVAESREHARAAGVADRVEFIHGDLFTNNLEAATVVILYLGHGANLDLRAPILASVKPGTRIVSHQFGMGEWPPDKKLMVRTPLLGMYSEMWNSFATNAEVPDYRTAFERVDHDVVSTWIVPPRIAGIWRGKVRVRTGEADLTIALHQRLSRTTGTYELAGATNLGGTVRADLWADHIRLWLTATNRSYYGQPMIWIDARATNDTLTGTIWLAENGTNQSHHEWRGERDRGDFTGTWEWPGPNGEPVRLTIARENRRLKARYVGKESVTIRDIYDFGGGFYFTLLLGQDEHRTGGSRRMGPNDGWLIGEAIATSNSIAGTIAFYPYQFERWMVGDSTPIRPSTNAVRTGPHDWHPVKRSL